MRSHLRNAVKPAGTKHALVTLSRGGRACYSIVIPEACLAPEKNAALLLAETLCKITGAEFPVLTDAHSRQEREICVGGTNRGRPTGRLGDDGYEIRQEGKTLLIFGGGSRGIVNGVVALLEEDIGCRWYARNVEILPRRATLGLRVASRVYVPQLKYRMTFHAEALYGEWSVRNRTSEPFAPVPAEWGGHMCHPTIGGRKEWYRKGKRLFVHTYHTLLPPDEYFDAHPEYFMLDDRGQRVVRQVCETHPDVMRIMSGNALKYLRDCPDSRTISVSKMDGGSTCLCERCRELNQREGSDAASMLYLVNGVAAEIEKEFPDVLVTTAAYLETVKLPKTIRPRANVGAVVCNDKCAWPYPMKPARQHAEMARIVKKWARLCKRLYFWDYTINFSHFCAPMPNMAVMADNMRFWVENHAEGVITNGPHQSPGADRDVMRAWVTAKLMWNPNWDWRKLMEDFVVGYYGQAAPAMLKYYRMIESLAAKHDLANVKLKNGTRFRMSEAFLDDYLGSAETLLEQAMGLAEDDEIRRRVERDWLAPLYVKLERWQGGEQAEYTRMVDRFERIARREGVSHTGETAQEPNIDLKLEMWRDMKRGALVKIVPPGGTFTAPVTVKVGTHVPFSRLNYTLDGSEPESGSPAMPEALEIRSSCLLKIGLYLVGSCIGSEVAQARYDIRE